MRVSISEFTGMAPKLAASMLPPNAAQNAVNVRLNSGSLRPFNLPKLESSKIAPGATSVFMLGPPGSALPLSWAADVDVAESPLSDSEYRVYYTGDGPPKKTSYSMLGVDATSFPDAWYYLGTPAPASAPSLAATTGSVPAGTYAYVFTYVTQFGAILQEESAPSAPTLITLGSTGGVAITGLASPLSVAGRNYVAKRIYRSAGGAYQLVAEIPFANTSYTDTLSATSILGDTLQSLEWLPPPDDLKGIIVLPSGVLAGFRENEVWFSEPGFPHAWPAKYMQTVASKIVAIKGFGNNIAVATTGFPYLGTGMHPETFTFQKLPFLEPCLSKRSMSSDERGVMYASSNGLVAIGLDGGGLVTREAMSRESFGSFGPESMIGQVFEGRYHGFYSTLLAGAGCMVYARENPAPISRLSLSASAVTVDHRTARMLYVDSVDDRLYRFDPPDTLPMDMVWKSKEFMASSAHNMGCFRVITAELSSADQAYAGYLEQLNAAIRAANVAILAGTSNLRSQVNASAVNEMAGVNGSILTAPQPAVRSTVNVSVWGGKTLLRSGEFDANVVHRLPDGRRYMTIEIQVTGQREVLGVQVASSPKELDNG